MAHQAQETFVAELAGGPLLVTKGQVFADGHEAVKLDAGRGLLFKPLDLGEAEIPARSAPPKAEAKAAPVKSAGKVP